MIIAGCQQSRLLSQIYARTLDVLSFGSRAKTPRSKGKGQEREKAAKSNKRARRTTGLK
jgi:hypothetical protein